MKPKILKVFASMLAIIGAIILVINIFCLTSS